MAKQSGLGANYYLDQFDLSNDTNSFGTISKKVSPLEMTGLDKLAMERIAGDLDAEMKWLSYFNPTNAHGALSALPRTDRIASYFHRATVGVPAASMAAKQTGYDPKRDANGMFTADVDALENGTWLDWGYTLTAGKRTDTTATNGASNDQNALGFGFTTSAAFGAQVYAHVFAFTGTSITLTLQDSADNATFLPVTGGAFTAFTGVGVQRIATARNQLIRRYVRLASSGTFSNAVFAAQCATNITDMTI